MTGAEDAVTPVAQLDDDSLHSALVQAKPRPPFPGRPERYAELLAEGRRRCFWRVVGRLATATTVGELHGIAARYAMPDTDSGTNGGGVLRTPVWAAEHEALYALQMLRLTRGVAPGPRRAVPYGKHSRLARQRTVRIRSGVL